MHGKLFCTESLPLTATQLQQRVRPEIARTVTTPVPPAPEKPGGRGRLVSFLGVAGELLITLALIVCLFAGYELKFTDLLTERSQHSLLRQVAARWSAEQASPTARPGPPVAVPAGQGLAILRIPRLGRDYSWVVVEGTSRADLKKGPGHLPGTALPGQLGNTVISGHRTTYGHPFWHLDELASGDEVDVQVGERVYRYRVASSTVVSPGDVGITRPTPETAPGRAAGTAPGTAAARLLTLTTCTPPFSASHRLVVRAVLTATVGRS
ncbi:MAG: class E sortase [Mycobacteriaceae bacterium]